MRKVFSTFAILALVALGVGLLSPPADAACAAPTSVGNNGYAGGGGSGAGYQYLQFPGKISGPFLGRFWQTNLPTNNEGTFDINAAMFQTSPGGDIWYFNLDLANAAVVGCPGGCLTIYVEDPASGRAILWTAGQLAGDTNNNPLQYDFTYDSFGTLVVDHGPRPRVTTSSRAGTDITVNFDVPDVAPNVRTQLASCGAGGDGAVSTRQAYIRQSATQPSTDIAGWTPFGTAANLAGPAAARSNVFNCSDTSQDWWIATGVSVNSQPARFVTSPVRVECDPNLADPTGTFKKIDRPGAGTPRTQGRD